MDSYEEIITRDSFLLPKGLTTSQIVSLFISFEHGTLPHNDPKKQNCPNWIKQVRQNFATTSKIMLIDCNWIQQQITMDLSLRSSTYTCQVGQSPPSPFTIPTLITCQKKQVRIARLMRLSFGSQCWAMLDVFRFGFLLNLRAQLTVSGGNASG